MIAGFLLALLLQEPDPQKIQEWVKMLGSEDVAVREEATKRLLEGGEKILPVLERYENAADAEVRGRLQAIRARLTPSKLRDIFACAEEALRKDSKVEEWRPKLRRLIEQYLELLGEEAPKIRRGSAEILARAFKEGSPVIRDNSTQALKGTTFLVETATGNVTDGPALVVCRSGDGVKLEEAVVICLGDLRASKVEDSIVFAQGSIDSRQEVEHSIVYCGGQLRSLDRVDNSAVHALGGSAAPRSQDSTYINTVWRADELRGVNREVKKEKLPGFKKE